MTLDRNILGTAACNARAAAEVLEAIREHGDARDGYDVSVSLGRVRDMLASALSDLDMLTGGGADQ